MFAFGARSRRNAAMMYSCNCPLLPKFIFAFGALQTVNDRRYPWAWSRQKAVPNRGLAIFLTVAIVVGLVLPAPADERPSDPFGNHTTELNRDAPLVGIWESLRDKCRSRKPTFTSAWNPRSRLAHQYPRSFKSSMRFAIIGAKLCWDISTYPSIS
jgi:hypothetical protein